MPTLDREFVRTMADVRARAEYLARVTRDAYRDAARYAPNTTRLDRAVLRAKARDYKRRLARVGQYNKGRS